MFVDLILLNTAQRFFVGNDGIHAPGATQDDPSVPVHTVRESTRYMG